MKILHINSYSVSNVLFDNLYDLQSQKEHEISVYVPRVKGKEEYKAQHQKYKSIVPVYTEMDRFFFFHKSNKILKNIQTLYNFDNFEIIHAHTLFSNGIIAYRLTQIYHIPYVITIQNTDLNLFFHKCIHLRPIGKKILQNAKRVIFISSAYKQRVLEDFVKKSFENEIAAKSVIIPYGIDPYWHKNKYHRERNNTVKSLNILSVGDVSFNKNQLSVCRACELLMKRGWKITYHIAGRIVDAKVYNELCEKDYVKYVGYKNKEELLQLYRACDVFVLPSKTETFGLVYGEALSQELPIIYTSGEGFDGNFPDGYVGYSVEADDSEAIMRYIIEIVNDYDRLIKNGTEAIKKFEWERIASAHFALYQESINGVK